MFLSSFVTMFLSAPLALTIPGGEGEVKINAPKNIPSGIDAPSNVLQTGMDLLIVAGVIAALLFTLYGGVLWITSGGDKAKLDKARHTITYSIIGLVIMILAFVIVQTIGFLLGSNTLSNLGKDKIGGVETPSACAAKGGICAISLSCAANKAAIGICSDNPVQPCCK